MTDGLITGDDLAPGHVSVDGCFNFRDAGGWPLRSGGHMRLGRLYRSEDATRLTPVGREVVDALGLAAVVDLRQDTQFARPYRFVPDERTIHVALVDRVIDPDNPPTMHEPSDIADLYEAMIVSSAPRLALALDAVAERLADGPVLVHCAYGKDRAGLVTAFVEAAIGVHAEAIVADYARSDGPTRARRSAVLASPLPDDPNTAHAPPYLFRAPAESMAIVLERAIAAHGSLVAWFDHLPVAPTTRQRLVDALVAR
ncbi:MAG: tyrosine-protein phosphatase [Ilumatobacteraceae bacterium]